MNEVGVLSAASFTGNKRTFQINAYQSGPVCNIFVGKIFAAFTNAAQYFGESVMEAGQMEVTPCDNWYSAMAVKPSEEASLKSCPAQP